MNYEINTGNVFKFLKNSYLYLIIPAILSVSCWNNSPYKGYSKTESGLYYKLQIIGDGLIKPSAGDLLQLSITYKTINDSVFMDSYSYNETGLVILPFSHSSFKGSFEEGLTKMNVGDSVSFIVSSDSLFQKFFRAELPFFLPKGSFVKVEVKLAGILNNEGYQNEYKKYKDVVEDLDINERCKLKMYLDTNQTQFSQLSNGMYYLPIKQGVGERAKSGNQVTINYKGFFLNGKQFESTYVRGQSLEFRLGEEGQVIKGFETAISLMNEGSKTKFIIPSHLAFGETGSSTKIIPAFTTVVYEIELLNIKK
jgi:FKBP-type peptidyl-prolyl cis-trans isomerase